ncbi:uncharacterized protein F4807DRAFT_454814 [Annulohypoxylon truncatum]|uniref:uncharacterized protein n=1 Tax=Annulohypoxylon truncatum TaxID=327061 RepID=UPI00200800C2|nr:uncharacterized protein F4807DRAFT_454814 [Annulohypoxylon truncatum]KAI1204216.1 hypothetical protein F4807DRAFT_454814 [Annulohypoxylon truncatum]
MVSDQVARADHGHTITALSRWSILDKKLPPVNAINAVHVYDFDNTLFKTPLPNPKLWNGPTVGQLMSPDIFVNGGWWHDSRILSATGEGVEQEEKRAWNGWWNEKIVQLVQLSMEQDDALTVLLTGRSEKGFSQLIKRIVASKGLQFDMIGLKPAIGPNRERFQSTMEFKQIFLRAVLGTYASAKEMRIYEDRPKHVGGFRDFFADYNKHLINRGLNPITGHVVPVAELSTTLDPVVEVAEVQHLINAHNIAVAKERKGGRSGRLAIKKAVLFTSYMIQPSDTKRLISLLNTLAPETKDLKPLANTILITARSCPQHILDKIGGLNSKMKWEVTDIGSYQSNLWAVRVRPVPANAIYHSDNRTPAVVMGAKGGTRPADVNKIHQWQPVPADQNFVFETTVGEKVMLRIDREDQDGEDDQHDRLFPHRGSKRKFPSDDDRQSRHHGRDRGNGARDYYNSSQSRGGGDNRGRGGHRGGGAPRGNRGGRGGYKNSGRSGKGAHGYRSLDDVDTRESSQNGYGAAAVSYDDNTFPALPQGGPQFHQHLPPPPPYGQPFPIPGQWPGMGGNGQGRPSGGPGPDLQNFY